LPHPNHSYPIVTAHSCTIGWCPTAVPGW
jgi:hypothetical protein